MDAPPSSRSRAVTLGRAGAAVTAASVAVNLLAYMVPVLGARRLAPADLGALATSMALVAIATMPGVGLQTAVAVCAARPGWDGRGVARLAWLTAIGCGGAVALATPVLSGVLRLPPALPPLLAAMTVPAVLAGWPLGVSQGGERFGRLAAGMVLLAVGRYAGVLAGLALGADLVGAVALGAVVAWLPPLVLLWIAGPAGGVVRSIGGLVGSAGGAGESARGAVGEAAVPEATSAPVLRGRAVFTAVSASLSILVASYADLVLARQLLPAEDSGTYAVGAVLTRAAIWAPQVFTVLALPRLARGRAEALRVGLALVSSSGLLLTAGVALLATPVVEAVGGQWYAHLAPLAPYFVAVGALWAVTVFLLNARLAAGARRPAAGVWSATVALVVAALVLRPDSVGQLLAYAVGAATIGAVTTGGSAWVRRKS